MFASRQELNERQREAANLETDRSASSRDRNRQDDDADGRVGVLLERGVTPERILLLTFTRRSAREIVSRVRTFAAPTRTQVSGGTFHSVAHHTLRRHHAAVGLPEGFGVLDRGDAAT